VYFNSDKIEPHQYFQSYVKIAADLGPEARVLELGVESGESLRIWQSLFPLGEITGVDIHAGSRWPQGTVKVISAQDDPELPQKLSGLYSLIVDDASHNGIATRKSFELLWPLVAPGGYYVIEDWMVSLRDAERPGETWGKSANWGTSMLRTAESMLPLLAYPPSHPDGECDSIEYRYGLIIIHRRKA
jgi:hypothetical protein